MSFFRNVLSLDSAQVRAPVPADRLMLVRFLRRVNVRFFSLTDSELDVLLHDPIGKLLLARDEVVALMLAGLAPAPCSWIRMVAIDDRLRLGETMPRLIELLHADARARGLEQLYFLGDLWSGSWLQAHLLAAGYTHYEEVVSYQKREWSTPALPVELETRPALESDLAAILALDSASFEPRWAKMPATIADSLQSPGLFLLAERGQDLAGYAFVSLHHAGRFAHLVRLAVAPAFRGQGIGAALLAQVCRFCERRQVETLSLNTQLSNGPARRLYLRFGFELTAERQSVLQARLLPE